MTLRTNARVAGFTFLLYIVVGIADMAISSRATGGEGIAARLASVAQHAPEVRWGIVLGLVQSFCALILAVTLYGLTRDVDHELAMLGLCCRVAEGVVGAIGPARKVALLWLATEGARAGTTDTLKLGALLFEGVRNSGAIFFAVGSTAFSFLLLRGRLIPAPLAWLGVVASLAGAIILPIEFVGLLGGTIVFWLVWLPLLAFEVPLALWLMTKGVRARNPGFSTASV